MSPQQRASEDFRRGSSDYPTHGKRFAYCVPRTFLELAEDVSVKVLTTDNSVDVERTNEARLKGMREKGYHPVLIVEGTKYYRVVHHDAEGLASISYSDTMPNPLEEVVAGELVAPEIAALLLGIPEGDIIRNAAFKAEDHGHKQYKHCWKSDWQIPLSAISEYLAQQSNADAGSSPSAEHT